MDEFAKNIDECPTPMHFMDFSRRLLTSKGFAEVREGDDLNYDKNRKFFVIRDEKSIVVVNSGDDDESSREISTKIFTTNLDYPYFLVKPNSGLIKNHYELLNVAHYGYGMWFSWMDRDLTIAGVVSYRCNNEIKQHLVYSVPPFCTIPSLASHMTNSSNRELQFEANFRPVVGFTDEPDSCAIHSPTLMKFLAKECNCNEDDIQDYELYLMSAEYCSSVGVNDEMIASQRLSSIGQAVVAMTSFANASPMPGSRNIFYGYTSENGCNMSLTSYQSNFLSNIISRISTNNEKSYKNVALLGGVRVPSTYSKPGSGVTYRSSPVFNGKSDQIILDKILASLNNSDFKYQKASNSYDINNGTHQLSVTNNAPPLFLGVPITNLHSIREIAYKSDFLAFKASLDCYFNEI